MPTACPNCKATVTVPGAPPEATPTRQPASKYRTPLIAGCIALVLFGGVAVAIAVGMRKPATEQARIDPPATPAPPHIIIIDGGGDPPKPPVEKHRPVAVVPDAPQPPAQPSTPKLPVPNIPPVSPTPQPVEPPQPPQQPTLAPPPHAVVQVPAQPSVPDRFGNPASSNAGLGRDGEFKGTKLLFWCAFENAGKVFFGPTNPLWKALEVKGFVVSRVFGKFNPAWLKEADQLWILSSGRMELPAGITPDLLADAVSLLPAEAIPSGFTLPEYQFIVRATLDVAFSPRHMLDEKAYKAIEEFVKAGKGLCLLADDEPFTAEADELARRLFGARVSGNYLADKTATVRGRGLTAAEIRKFGGQYEVDDHPLLTGVNFLFEGITVSNVSKSDKLGAALLASDGKTLIAVSKVPGQRVVIDCGFTRYCHGPTERTSYVFKTAGTIRLGQNIAAYLAGKDSLPKP